MDAIFRAAVNGFGLIEKPVESVHQQLQILARHRRDLVKKKSKLQCQIRHHLEQGLPGFAAMFDGTELWTQATPVPLLQAIARRGGTADVVRKDHRELGTLLVAVLARPGVASKDDDVMEST